MKAKQSIQPALPFHESDYALISAFERHAVVGGHSERTLRSRRELLERLAIDYDLMTITGEELVHWLSTRRNRRTGEPISPSSRATYTAQARAFFTWMQATGRRDDNPGADIPKIRVPKTLPRPFTPEQVQAILEACSDPRAHSTRGYVLLGAFAGLRNHEIAKVRGEDIASGLLRVVGKGGNEWDLPLHELIRDYAETMPWKGYWFPSESAAGHVHRCSVGLAISRALERAKVPGTPHQLRHHFGTQVLRGSSNLRLTQRALRHASPATTAIYTLLTDEELQWAIDNIPRPTPADDGLNMAA